jgi:C1A family cysteine protease
MADDLTPDHTIAIVGWDDARCSGNGAWIIKNNYGAGWGDNGYGYVQYDRADLVGFTAMISAYRDVDPNEHIIAYDEAGYNKGVGFAPADWDDWGMAVIDPTSSNDELTAVEFWTGTPTTNYWI